MHAMLKSLVFAALVAPARAGFVNSFCVLRENCTGDWGYCEDDDSPGSTSASFGCTELKTLPFTKQEVYISYNVPDDGTCVSHHANTWGPFSFKVVKESNGSYTEFDYDNVTDCSGTPSKTSNTDLATCYTDAWTDECYLVACGDTPPAELYDGEFPYTSGSAAPDFAADCSSATSTDSSCLSYLGSASPGTNTGTVASYASCDLTIADSPGIVNQFGLYSDNCADGLYECGDDDSPGSGGESFGCTELKTSTPANQEVYYFYNVPADGTCLTSHLDYSPSGDDWDYWDPYSFSVVRLSDGSFLEYNYKNNTDCSAEPSKVIDTSLATCYEDVWNTEFYIVECDDTPPAELYTGDFPYMPPSTQAPDYAADCGVLTDGQCASWLGSAYGGSNTGTVSSYLCPSPTTAPTVSSVPTITAAPTAKPELSSTEQQLRAAGLAAAGFTTVVVWATNVLFY